MLKDSPIQRIYQCTDLACEGEFSVIQKAKDNFKKKCPFCKKKSLVIKSATSSFSFIQSLNKPKTIGALAEKNSRDRPENVRQEKKPWWREKESINMKVLKNPKYFIETGKL